MIFLKKLLIWLCPVLVVAGSIFSHSTQTLSRGIQDLVPWPGIELRPSALEGQSPDHWATRACTQLLQLCPTPCKPMDYRLSGPLVQEYWSGLPFPTPDHQGSPCNISWICFFLNSFFPIQKLSVCLFETLCNPKPSTVLSEVCECHRMTVLYRV